jgi:tRNA threonylcarbamoyladenosine biosynthesis protein TsaE
MTKEFSVITLEDWDKAAQFLKDYLSAPALIALSGPLGAGKTTLVQALAHALGVVDRPRSPTFSLLRAYTLPTPIHGIKRLVHIDAYRLDQPSDIHALDLAGELSEPGTIVAIEWAEQLGETLKTFNVPVIYLNIEPKEGTKRNVNIHL